MQKIFLHIWWVVSGWRIIRVGENLWLEHLWLEQKYSKPDHAPTAYLLQMSVSSNPNYTPTRNDPYLVTLPIPETSFFRAHFFKRALVGHQ